MKTGVLVSLFSALLIGLPVASMAGVAGDVDSDGVVDNLDNCISLVQLTGEFCDTDQDGYGNACDGDFDQNFSTNTNDFLGSFLPDFTSGPPAVDSGVGTDMDCNGSVNTNDFLNKFLPNFTSGPPAVPGPSGLACAGTVPCTH